MEIKSVAAFQADGCCRRDLNSATSQNLINQTRPSLGRKLAAAEAGVTVCVLCGRAGGRLEFVVDMNGGGRMMMIRLKHSGGVYFGMERRWWPSKAAPSCQAAAVCARMHACPGPLQEHKVRRPAACITHSNEGWNPLIQSPSLHLPAPPLWSSASFHPSAPASAGISSGIWGSKFQRQTGRLPLRPSREPRSRSCVATLMLSPTG